MIYSVNLSILNSFVNAYHKSLKYLTVTQYAIVKKIVGSLKKMLNMTAGNY